MTDTVGIAIAIGVVAVMLLLIFIKSNLIICSPNEALIFSGRRRKLPDGSTVGFRAIRGGRGFRIPFLESVSRIALNAIPIEIQLSKALAAGMIPIDVQGIATVKVAGTEEQGLSNAIERFLGKSPHEISTVARDIVEGSLRGVLAQHAPEEANENRLAIAREAAEAAREDLGRLGLVLDTLKIQNLSDPEGYLEAIGRKKNAEVRRNARIAEATADSEARKVAAEAKRNASIAEAEAEKAIVEADNGLRVRRAELAAESNRAEEKATVAREIARAEEERTLEEVRVGLNQKKHEAETVVPARAERDADRLRAEGKAARILEDGKASAEALALLQAQWKDDSAREVMLLQMLPKLLSQVTSVLNDNLHVERLTVIDSGDGGGLPSHVKGVTGSVVAVLEQIKNATGLDIPGILESKRRD